MIWLNNLYGSEGGRVISWLDVSWNWLREADDLQVPMSPALAMDGLPRLLPSKPWGRDVKLVQAFGLRRTMKEEEEKKKEIRKRGGGEDKDAAGESGDKSRT